MTSRVLAGLARGLIALAAASCHPAAPETDVQQDPSDPGIGWQDAWGALIGDSEAPQTQPGCPACPHIEVVPKTVTFPSVSVGASAQSTVYVYNSGSQELVINTLQLIPIWSGLCFSAIANGVEYGFDSRGSVGVFLINPIVLAPAEGRYLAVRFAPINAGPAKAELRLLSNDPVTPVLTVALGGNGAGGGAHDSDCILAAAGPVQFGGLKVGTAAHKALDLVGCAKDGAVVTGIAMANGTSPEFHLDFSSLDHVPSPEAPLIVPAGEKLQLQVAYVPADVSPILPNGDVLPDHGTVMVRTFNSPEQPVVETWGAGVDTDCPSAIIRIEDAVTGAEVGEGDVVPPPALLRLSGIRSFAVTGPVSQWEWSVEQPAISSIGFMPNAASPRPSFTAMVPGIYTFRLAVRDRAGTPSCFPAKQTLLVSAPQDGGNTSGSGITVELIWGTPGDPDETDTGADAGSDLDLHFLHPWAAGPDLDQDGYADGWFDIPFDVFWFNAHPNWGSYDPAANDDPDMIRDDTDGLGPELIHLENPEPFIYRVGAHYWNDHGYGPAYATVRVYLKGVLAFEAAGVELVDSDMWSVCVIDWVTGTVTPVTDETGQHKIAPNYKNPYFSQ